MDGIGGKIKTQIKDTIGYNPNKVISKTNDLLEHLPIMENIVIGTYTEDNVKQFSALLPISKKLKIISTFGLSKVHEIYFSKDDDKVIK